MHARNSFKKIFFKSGLSKKIIFYLTFIFKNWIFSFAPNLLLWTRSWKTKETSYQSLFGLQSVFRKKHFLVILRQFWTWFKFVTLGNLDDLIQSGFWVLKKTTFVNSCKPVHDVIIIPVPSDPLNLKTVERKGDYKKLNMSRRKRAF